MKRKVLWIILLDIVILTLVALFSKPSDAKCKTKAAEELSSKPELIEVEDNTFYKTIRHVNGGEKKLVGHAFLFMVKIDADR